MGGPRGWLRRDGEQKKPWLLMVDC